MASGASNFVRKIIHLNRHCKAPFNPQGSAAALSRENELLLGVGVEAVDQAKTIGGQDSLEPHDVPRKCSQMVNIHAGGLIPEQRSILDQLV